MKRPTHFLTSCGSGAILGREFGFQRSEKLRVTEVQARFGETVEVVVAASDHTIRRKLQPSRPSWSEGTRGFRPKGAFTDPRQFAGRVSPPRQFVANETVVASKRLWARKTSGVMTLLIPGRDAAMAVPAQKVSTQSKGFVKPHTRVDPSCRGLRGRRPRRIILLADSPPEHRVVLRRARKSKRQAMSRRCPKWSPCW